jgi:hypothetical protein
MFANVDKPDNLHISHHNKVLTSATFYDMSRETYVCRQEPFKEIRCENVNWILLAQDRYQWRVLVNR